MTTYTRIASVLAILVAATLLTPGCRKSEPAPEVGPAESPAPEGVTPSPEPVPVPPPDPKPAPGAEPAEATPPVAEAGDAWMTDFDVAKTVAAKEGKDVLVDFSGSDWCGWCIKLDSEVFSKEEFISAARKDFVLVVLDFPRKPENKAKIPAAQQKRNSELKDEMGVRGFPSVFLTDAAGVVYAQTGYQPGGPENYLKHLQGLKANKAKKDALIETLKDPAIAGVERAKLLHEVIKTTPDELAVKQHEEDMKQIVALDPENAAGLKSIYQLKLRKGEAQAAMDARDFKKAAGVFETIVAEFKPTGQELQDLWMEAGAPYFYLKDMDGVRKCLDNALKAAPEGEQVERINAMMKRFFPEPEKAAKPEAATPAAAPAAAAPKPATPAVPPPKPPVAPKPAAPAVTPAPKPAAAEKQ